MRLYAWIIVGLAIVALIFIAGAAAFTYIGVRQFVADSPIQLPTLGGLSLAGPSVPSVAVVPTLPPFVSQATTATPVAGQSSLNTPLASPGGPTATGMTSVPSIQTAPTLDPVLQNPTRVTVLIMAIDQLPGEKGPFQTDTMIVISIDPLRKTAAMLSVLRDIYVPIPGYSANRVDTAEGMGETVDYPGGGPVLAIKTVENLLGVPIQHYFLLNFAVFSAVMDAVGPLQVCPAQAIHDTAYPDDFNPNDPNGVITVDFPAGCQMLGTIQLIEYSRVRHNSGDDYGRAARQQEVITAVRNKVLSLGGFSALISKAGTIWGAVKSNVKTDMTFDQMAQLAQIALTIPKENISSAELSLQSGYVIPSTTSLKEQVLAPVYEKIHQLVEQMFDAQPGKPVIDMPVQP